MRKLLLATTAVVATAVIAPAAMAQDAAGAIGRMSAAGTSSLSVRIGGFFEFRAYSINDDNDRNAVTRNGRRFGRQPVDFQNEIELNVFLDGKAANGMVYGAVLELQMDGNQSQTSSAVNFDETYAFFSYPTLGTLRFGVEDSAASLLTVRAPNIQGTSISDFGDEAFIAQSNILGINDGNDATKIIYLSPQFFGFDFGLSYAPNGGEGEGQTENGVRDRDRLGLRNEISAGLRYRGTMGPIGFSAAFVAMQADTNARYGGPNTVRSRTNAFQTGFQAAFYGITVGADYMWGDYRPGAPGRVAQNRGEDATQQWVVGATYTVPGQGIQVGAYYGRFDADTNGNGPKFRQEGYGFGINYALAPGLITFANYTHLRDTNAATDQNLAQPGIQRTRNAEAYMAGFRLAF